MFGWGIVKNLLLASAQGAVYIVAALLSQKLARMLGNRRLLILANIGLAAVGLIALLANK